MSSCGGSCNCGSNCNCGSGCKRFIDLESTTTKIIILEAAPVKSNLEGFEMAGSEGCSCGDDCSCDPCTC